MARAYVVLLSLLALLLALGLTAGAFFSLPVAVFATTCLLLSVLSSAYVMSDPDLLDPESMASLPILQRAQFHLSTGVTRVLAAASAPALKTSPLGHLSSAEWIPENEITGAIAGNALVLPAILAILSSVFLARRELPE
jgi:hypothetical protein